MSIDTLDAARSLSPVAAAMPDAAAASILRRAVEEAAAAALPAYWARRAAIWEWARPRPGDYTGRATPAELDALDARCAATAQACRNAAELARSTRPWWLDGEVL